MEIKTAVEIFKKHQIKTRAYEHAMGMLYYDARTAAPRDSSEPLGQTLGVLSEESYKLSVNDDFKALVAFLIKNKDSLDFQTRREAEEISDNIEKTGKIPIEEYSEYQMLINESEHVWHQAKLANDYASFEPLLAKVVEFQRRFAHYWAPDKDPYDTLLDKYEKGLTCEILDKYFSDIRTKLVPLIKKIAAKNSSYDFPFTRASYPIEKQREFSSYLMDVMSIDKNRCVIGETEHPFTIEFSKKDVRITTNYKEKNFLSNLYSVIHEGGHALYELNTGDSLMGSALAHGISMGVHESQSRFFENIIGRSKYFTNKIFPKLVEFFPENFKGVSPDDLYRAVNKSEPSLIRTEADELTYSMHILVRYELEKRLISGELSTKELPEAWNELYEKYLGITVPDDTHGVLQDTHWSGGSFGYFPSYSIGSAYAAQILASMEKDIDVWGCVSDPSGDLAPIVQWLTERIYKFGMMITPSEAIFNCCSAAFDPSYYTDYLIKKFTKIYDL